MPKPSLLHNDARDQTCTSPHEPLMLTAGSKPSTPAQAKGHLEDRQSNKCLTAVVIIRWLVLLWLAVLSCIDNRAYAGLNEVSAFDVAHAKGLGDWLDTETQDVAPSDSRSLNAPASEPTRYDPEAWRRSSRGLQSIGLWQPGRWVKGDLTNSGQSTITGWIRIAKPFTDRIDCSLQQDHTAVQQFHMGDQLPFEQRPVRAGDFLVPVTLGPNQRATLTCLIKNDGVLVSDLSFWSPTKYLTYTERQATLRVAAYGALLFAILAGAALAVVDRRGLAFFLVVDLAPVLMGSLCIEGDGFRYLWPDVPNLNIPPYYWILIGLFAEILLIRACIELSTSEKRVLATMGLVAAFVFAQAVLDTSIHPLCTILTLILGATYAPIFIWICVRHRAESPIGQVLALGISFQAVALWVNALGVFGLSAFADGTSHLQLASLAASVLKGIMLATSVGMRARQDKIGRENLQVAYTKELSEKLEYQKELTAMLLRDPLYGQPNQRALEDALRRAPWNDDDRLTIWVVKLQRMTVLQTLVPMEVLHAAMCDHIHQLARFLRGPLKLQLLNLQDGAEIGVLSDNLFAFCSFGTPPAGSIEQLTEQLLARFPWKGMYFAWDPHLGIATIPISEAKVDLLTKARLALNRCNAHHRTQIYAAESGMREHHLQGLMMDIVGAIERNEMVLYYQPKVQLSNMETKSFEALIRWRHPEKGIISPNEFIAEAEATGCIHRLTLWVIGEAARFIQRLDNPTVRVAVNISAFDLATPSFIEAVQAILKRERVTPDRLILEITESVAVDDVNSTKRLLQRLRDYGVQISLDDFGTGQSSLGMLEELPLDEIKIDRTLTIDVETSSTKRAVLSSMIELGKRLGLTVTVEGVETTWLLEWLQAVGAEVVQGYYFSRPLPESQAVAWLTNKPRYLAVQDLQR